MKVLLAVVGVLLVALLGGVIWVRSYLRSEDFRKQLEQQIGSAVGGQAEIAEIEWHGTTLELGQLDLKSEKAGSWRLRDVDTKVDLAGFWDRVWLVPKIEIRQATSEWDLRAGKQDNAPKTSSSSASKGSGRRGSGFLPNRSEVHEVTILDYEGEVMTEQGAYAWDGMRLTTRPNPQGTTLVTLGGGRLRTPLDWLGTLKLESGMLALREGELSLDRSEWMTDSGPLTVRGKVQGENREWEAAIENWDIQPLLPEEWKPFLTGRATGGGLCLQDSLQAGFEIEKGTVEGLPFLERLAAYAGTPRLRRLTLEEASFTLERRASDHFQVKDLVLFDEGLLRVEGYLNREPSRLEGELSLGVPPGLLAHIPGAEEKVFLPGAKGLLWTKVNLSGTWENPEEDLSERMIRAAGERMFEMIPETGKWALRYSGEALDQGTRLLVDSQGLILEEGGKAIEQSLEKGTELLDEGLKTGFGILDSLLPEED